MPGLNHLPYFWGGRTAWNAWTESPAVLLGRADSNAPGLIKHKRGDAVIMRKPDPMFRNAGGCLMTNPAEQAVNPPCSASLSARFVSAWLELRRRCRPMRVGRRAGCLRSSIPPPTYPAGGNFLLIVSFGRPGLRGLERCGSSPSPGVRILLTTGSFSPEGGLRIRS